MSETKTKCTDCGAAIQQWTADTNDGRCVPCFRKAKATPPQDFELPRDLAARLAALIEDPASYRSMAWRNGSEFLAGFIDKLEEKRELYLEWAPRLRTFAAECRKSRPLPLVDSLTPSERAQQLIYQSKIELPQLARPDMVAICKMPLIAMQVAQGQLPTDDNRIVLLTPEEETRWNEIYEHAEESFRWFADFWWIIDDAPARKHTQSDHLSADWKEADLQVGEQPWLFDIGHSFGSLAGGGDTELWAWNGREARFVKLLSTWVS